MPAQTVSDVNYVQPDQLELRDGTRQLLFSATFLDQREGEFEINRQGIQADQSNLQGYMGDGRIIIGEHTFFVLYYGQIATARSEILAALPDVRWLTVNPGGDEWEMASGKAISSEDQVGTNVWRIGITFLPLRHDSSNGVGLR